MDAESVAEARQAARRSVPGVAGDRATDARARCAGGGRGARGPGAAGLAGQGVAVRGVAGSGGRSDGAQGKRNLHEAKALGVTDMVFERKRGLQVEDMASTPGVYDKLRRFRAGIEAAISYLKRCFGLRRCHWRGLDHFRAYVWSAIVAHNLAVLARSRLQLKPT